MHYCLYNRLLDTYLIHPTIGLWTTNDLQEAEEMLAACRRYVRSFDQENYEEQFIIVHYETGEEVCKSPQPAKT